MSRENEQPAQPIPWVLAVLGAAVVGLVVGWNLHAADLPLWPGG